MSSRYREGVARREEPGLIIRLAKYYDVAPALIAKVILEESLEPEREKGGKGKNAVFPLYILGF